MKIPSKECCELCRLKGTAEDNFDCYFCPLRIDVNKLKRNKKGAFAFLKKLVELKDYFNK